MVKKKIIHGLVFTPRHMGDTIFVTSYLRACINKVKQQLIQQKALQKNENMSYILTFFSYNFSDSYTLVQNFPHDRIIIQSGWKLRKLWVVLILLLARVLHGNTYQFCVTPKSIGWLKKIGIFRPLPWCKKFKPVLWSSELANLMPGNQRNCVSIPYRPLIPISDQDFSHAKTMLAGKPSFIFAPFTSAEHKNWPLSHWEVFLKQMNQFYPKHQFYFMGSQQDQEKINTLCSYVSGSTVNNTHRNAQHNAHPVLGLPLTTVAALMIQSDLFIGLETGAFNLAVAMVYQGYDVQVIGICSIKQHILVPEANPHIVYLSPTKQYDLQDAIAYRGESMITSVSAKQVLDAVHHFMVNR